MEKFKTTKVVSINPLSHELDVKPQRLGGYKH